MKKSNRSISVSGPWQQPTEVRERERRQAKQRADEEMWAPIMHIITSLIVLAVLGITIGAQPFGWIIILVVAYACFKTIGDK
jgi:hypothetical protein